MELCVGYKKKSLLPFNLPKFSGRELEWNWPSVLKKYKNKSKKLVPLKTRAM